MLSLLQAQLDPAFKAMISVYRPRSLGAQNNRLAIDYAIDPQRRERVPDAGEGLGIVGRGASPQALAVKRTERDLLDHLVGAGE
jgi:hypothetical protein